MILTSSAGTGDVRLSPAPLLDGASVEVTTIDAKAIVGLSGRLPHGTEIFIAALPKDREEDVVATAMRVARAGFTPVPHIVARNIADAAGLRALVGRLAGEAGVDRALVLGGDRDQPRGDFHSARQLIATGVFADCRLGTLYLAAYPEGHPRIPDAVLDAERAAKIADARAAGHTVELVTQLCFDAAPVIRLAARLRDRGEGVSLRVGVAGPASRVTLLKYALICGVGASVRALRERQDNARAMLSGETPEAVLATVAAARAADPGLPVSGAHFFTFGAVGPTIDWIASHRA